VASFPSLSTFTVLMALLTASCSPAGLQRQDQFAWAIEGADSTSPPIVRVRLTDSPNGSGAVRCMFGRTLIDAIMQEKRLPMTKMGYREAVAFALSAHDHSYRFVRPASLKVINGSQGIMDAGLLKGCKLIEHGKSALWADMQATVVEGPHFPMVSDPR
jgi:hypothetical protein